MEFKPQSVCASSAFLWFRDGLILSGRKPLAFIFAVSAYACLIYLPHFARMIFMWALPAFIGATCIIARASDVGDSAWTCIRKVESTVWLRLLVVGMWPVLKVFVVVLALQMEPSSVEEAHPAQGTTNEGEVFYERTFPGGCVILSALSWMFLVTFGFLNWFTIPLISVEGLTVFNAVYQATQALIKNPFVVVVAIVFGLVCLVGEHAGVAAFPIIAVFSSMMYVSYRHIWFDRGIHDTSTATSVRPIQT